MGNIPEKKRISVLPLRRRVPSVPGACGDKGSDRFPTLAAPCGCSARVTRIMAGACLAFFAAVYAAYLCGARINRTHSLPKGLYWVVDKQPERGDVVAFWPQDTEAIREAVRRGYLIPGAYNDGGRGGYGLILKKLLAVPGDAVSLTDAGVAVNGSLIPNTKPLDRDNIGAPLPVVRFENRRLAEGEALFISDHLPRSYDARYFGIQEMRQIVEVVTPVWTW